MPDITIGEIMIGSSTLAVKNNGNRDNLASTLYVSSAPRGQRINSTLSYNKELVWGGIPLTLVLLEDAITDPSAQDTIGTYYALSIIKNTNPEDVETNPSVSPVVPTSPTDRTFTLNGNRLSASKIGGRYYINIVETGSIPTPFRPIIFRGIPMAKGGQDELVIFDSTYSINNVDELVNIVIGGTSLTAGRIGNNYHLITKTITEIAS